VFFLHRENGDFSILMKEISYEIVSYSGFKNTNGWHNEAGISKDTSSNK
jgi:hypothetical protein